jgi:ribonuclease J
MTDTGTTPSPGGMPPDGTLEVVALGGVGEFGMNMMAVSYADTTIVIDAGVMFPDPDQPGVDLIVPDLTWLRERKGRVKALVLTHGHEDHIGGVPYVLPLVDGPVYGTPLTLALIEPKLEEHGLTDETGRLTPVRPRDVVTVGPFSIEFLRVTHSMPDCAALAVHTPVGTIVHTGDFKIDQTPLDGEACDLQRFAELGSKGVLAMFGDSTNVDRPGFTGSERVVLGAFEELFATAPGRLVVALFSSSLHRMQLLVDLAVQFDRKIAVVGRSLVQNTEIAQRLGRLRIPAGMQIRDVDVAGFAPEDVLCLTTGSQGEPRAALSRIAVDDHRYVRVEPEDTVVFSARAIPGNEKAIARVMDHLARRGASVVDSSRRIHVSGHGSEEELKLLVSLVRPRYFVPVHGEYRHLSRHAAAAKQVLAGGPGRSDVLLAENGDVLHFTAMTGRIAGRAPVGRVLVDVTRVGEVNDEVLRDRRHLSGDGVVVAVVALNRQTGQLVGPPELLSRGMVIDAETDARLLADAGTAVADAVAETSAEQRADQGLMTEVVRDELRRFFKKRTGRRPMVLPALLEI